jgi:hypothetical protein
MASKEPSANSDLNFFPLKVAVGGMKLPAEFVQARMVTTFEECSLTYPSANICICQFITEHTAGLINIAYEFWLLFFL